MRSDKHRNILTFVHQLLLYAIDCFDKYLSVSDWPNRGVCEGHPLLIYKSIVHRHGYIRTHIRQHRTVQFDSIAWK